MLSGLAHKNGNALGDGPGDHARAGASYLTGVHPRKTAGADIQNGVSVDQVLAQRPQGQDAARLPGARVRGVAHRRQLRLRLQLRVHQQHLLALGHHPDTRRRSNPRMAFERLFGADDVPLDAEARARRARDRRSILDLVSDRTRSLQGELGPADRRKLDEYLTGVREIERQIERAEQDGRDVAPPFEKPSGIPADFADYVKLMFDLQVAAFQADLTRVSTFMIGREGSLQSYPEIGVPDSHHPLTHHRGQPDLVEKRHEDQRLPRGAVRALRRRGSPPPRRATGRSARPYDAGRVRQRYRRRRPPHPRGPARPGRGWPRSRLKTGRHVVCPKETPMTNLFLTLLDHMGVEAESLGDSTGRLDLA